MIKFCDRAFDSGVAFANLNGQRALANGGTNFLNGEILNDARLEAEAVSSRGGED